VSSVILIFERLLFLVLRILVVLRKSSLKRRLLHWHTAVIHHLVLIMHRHVLPIIHLHLLHLHILRRAWHHHSLIKSLNRLFSLRLWSILFLLVLGSVLFEIVGVLFCQFVVNFHSEWVSPDYLLVFGN